MYICDMLVVKTDGKKCATVISSRWRMEARDGLLRGAVCARPAAGLGAASADGPDGGCLSLYMRCGWEHRIQ